MKDGDIQKQENATSHVVRLVADLLRKHSPINLFEFVINPFDYGQTVENIFYLSFSVGDCRARIDLDDNGIPIVSYVESVSDEEKDLPKCQCILEMTMQYWEDLVRALDITESIIPNRPKQVQSVTGQRWY